MNIKKTAISLAISTGLAIGVSEQAAASIYAGSRLFLEDVQIVIIPSAGTVSVGDWSFNTRASSDLNGANDIQTSSCGTIGTACVAGPPVLQDISNAPGGNVARDGTNTFDFLGPGAPQITSTQNFANSAAEITSSQLSSSGANPTEVKQISETEIAGTGEGSAGTNVSSTTQFDFSFSVSDTATFSIVFNAIADLFVSIDTANLVGNGIASSEIGYSLELVGTGGEEIQWDGTSVNVCDGGVTCAQVSGFNINRQLGLLPLNPSARNFNQTGAFSLDIENLGPGDYTLTLGASTFVKAEQTTVPEPTLMALLGLGMLGFGYIRRKVSV